MQDIRIGVLVITYNRPNLFEKCLASVVVANNSRKFPVVVVRQKSNADYSEILAKNINGISQLIEVDGSSRNTEENINYNRVLGMRKVFEQFDCDYVITIEDDAIVKNTAFDFCYLVAEEFGSNPRFRGVNYGSRIPYVKELEFTYSKLRYGCHGPASMFSRRVWKKCKLDGNDVKSGIIAWDGWVEAYLKTGFMITPNLSMYMDLGTSGTHTSDFTSDSYFAELQNSFVDSIDNCSKIKLSQQVHSWRSDSISYKKYQDFEYRLRYSINSIRQKSFKLK